MKKKILGIMAVTLLLSGCGKVPKLENGKDAVVTFKNGDKISVDDLYENIKDNYALSGLITMIDKYVLETEFKDYMDTAKEYAESYIGALKENYDSDEEFIQALQSYVGVSSIEAYQDYIYLSYMQTHATEEYAKAQITEKQIKDYYKNSTVGDIEVSHILITPNVKDDMSDEDKEKAEKEAKKTAEDIIKTLKEAKPADLSKKFTELAKEKSKDEATKDKGGALGKFNKNTLGSEYDELVKAAYEIKDGEIYDKVITTELGYHVILKTKSYDKPSLEDAKEDIVTTLSKNLMSEDQTIAINSLQHYRKELGMEIQDDTLKNQYSNYISYQLASATTSTEDSK